MKRFKDLFEKNCKTLIQEIHSSKSKLSLEQFNDIVVEHLIIDNKDLKNYTIKDNKVYQKMAQSLLLPYYVELLPEILSKKLDEDNNKFYFNPNFNNENIPYLKYFRKNIDFFAIKNLSDFNYCYLLNGYLSGKPLDNDPVKYAHDIGLSFCFSRFFKEEFEAISNSPIENIADMIKIILKAKKSDELNNKNHNFDFLLISTLVLLTKNL